MLLLARTPPVIANLTGPVASLSAEELMLAGPACPRHGATLTSRKILALTCIGLSIESAKLQELARSPPSVGHGAF